MSKKDRAWLKFALSLAQRSEARLKHGCVIVKGGSVLSTGINKKRNSIAWGDAYRKHFPGCMFHAEEFAIRRAKASLQGAVLYVARINNNGEPRLSKPCDRCYTEIAAAGIRKVVWT